MHPPHMHCFSAVRLAVGVVFSRERKKKKNFIENKCDKCIIIIVKDFIVLIYSNILIYTFNLFCIWCCACLQLDPLSSGRCCRTRSIPTSHGPAASPQLYIAGRL